MSDVKRICMLHIHKDYILSEMALTVHQRALFLPYGDHSLSIFVLLFVHINVSSSHVLDSCNVATSSTHDPRHNRSWHRQLL